MDWTVLGIYSVLFVAGLVVLIGVGVLLALYGGAAMRLIGAMLAVVLLAPPVFVLILVALPIYAVFGRKFVSVEVNPQKEDSNEKEDVCLRAGSGRQCCRGGCDPA